MAPSAEGDNSSRYSGQSDQQSQMEAQKKESARVQHKVKSDRQCSFNLNMDFAGAWFGKEYYERPSKPHGLWFVSLKNKNVNYPFAFLL